MSKQNARTLCVSFHNQALYRRCLDHTHLIDDLVEHSWNNFLRLTNEIRLFTLLHLNCWHSNNVWPWPHIMQLEPELDAIDECVSIGYRWQLSADVTDVKTVQFRFALTSWFRCILSADCSSILPYTGSFVSAKASFSNSATLFISGFLLSRSRMWWASFSLEYGLQIRWQLFSDFKQHWLTVYFR